MRGRGKGRKTQPLRAAFSLALSLVFFLEGNTARAAEPPALGSEQKTPWHVVASYGQASAPRSQGFAEGATLGVGRDFPLFGVFKWGLEVTPLFVVNQTRVDLPGRPRETVFAFAALPLLVFDAFPSSSVNVRLEGGVGVFWALSPVPAQGSRGNFYDLFGARLRLRVSPTAALGAGIRRTHVSNLGLAGPDNPGLSFYAGVLALDLAR